MTTHRPFFIGHGAASVSHHEKACLIQRAALLHAEKNGYLDKIPFRAVFVDTPCWLNNAINDLAIACNDTYGYERRVERQKLQDLLPRILEAYRQAPAVERRISFRINTWLTRKVLQHVDDEAVTALYVEIMQFAEDNYEALLPGIYNQEIEDEQARLTTLMTELHNQRQPDGTSTDDTPAGFEVIWRLIWTMLHIAAHPGNALGVLRQLEGDDFDPYEMLEDCLDIYDKECAEQGVTGDHEVADDSVEVLVNTWTAARRAALAPFLAGHKTHDTNDTEGDTDDDE